MTSAKNKNVFDEAKKLLEHFKKCISMSLFQVPLVTMLMSGKRKKDYVAVFSSIFELLTPAGETRVKEFMIDFEAAMWQACRAIFPTVKPVGCSFHLTQSFYRNISLACTCCQSRKSGKDSTVSHPTPQG